MISRIKSVMLSVHTERVEAVRYSTLAVTDHGRHKSQGKQTCSYRYWLAHSMARQRVDNQYRVYLAMKQPPDLILREVVTEDNSKDVKNCIF